jgi:DNA-binding NarL/FixJ family response regulator
MPLTILIADDDTNIRIFVKHYFEIQGYSVVTAKNGEEALFLAEEYHPHILISDINMPNKNGYDLVKQLRQKPQFRLLPVIFLTEKNTTEARINGYKVGCDAYLPKPFEMEELSVIVNSLLEKSHIFQSELWFSEQQQKSNSDELKKNSQLNLPKLTSREKEVLDLLSKGFSNIKIAEELYLSSKTIEKYVSSLLQKTNTKNRTELVRFALDNHLLKL